MPLFRLLRRMFPSDQLPDTFALRRTAVLDGVATVIRCRKPNERLIVAAHFPQTFSELAGHLEARSLQFHIADRPIHSASIRSAFAESPVLVTLAAMLQPSLPGAAADDFEAPVSVIVTERHPLSAPDDQIESFVSGINGPSRLAYFLSFEDPLIRRWIHPRAIEILRQFGLNENELISSQMVSRTLRRRQKRAHQKMKSETAADSIERWLQLNLPGDR